MAMEAFFLRGGFDEEMKRPIDQSGFVAEVVCGGGGFRWEGTLLTIGEGFAPGVVMEI